ncbi:MAG TPA: DEAD/DEAH box helicase [Candidatus Omnitrophota bacterium]|nr:DEAD/DEAH box helicase [Candidatus Omnitrophota bacterium]HRY86045.1 DEAD/DEAH box helicase [Candidatus Omnitrophota bacterium]
MTTHPAAEPPAAPSFYGLGIAPHLLETLQKMKFHTPTPIQQKAIPLAVEGQDVIGIAQTGTGKTLAFGIPMIQRLAQKKGRGLVLVPTRELAYQVHQSIHKIDPKLKFAVLIGGASMHHQIQELRQHPRILIATPGRLIDHMEQRYVFLNEISVLVLDEADRMLDMGFAPQIQKILRVLPKERQTMLFSATMPDAIMKIATSQMKLPVHIEIAKSGTVAEKITQEVFVVKKEAKRDLLKKILAQYHGTVLVFSRTKIGAYKITRAIREMGHHAAEIHADRSLAQRREALEGFKSGKYRILVATDIAARGIDVKGIELVINYDLPDESENYVHRIGRTGRIGDKGHAISFATPEQGKEVKDIEKLMRMALPISEHPEMPLESFIEHKPVKVASFGGGRFGRRGRSRGYIASAFRRAR